MSRASWTNSCSTVTLTSKPIICTIPEQTPELTLTSTLTGLSFTAQAQGMLLIYDDTAHTILSDVVVFSNVLGVATVAFLSDTDGIPVTAQGLPILGQFTESNKPISISVALSNGQFLNSRICSDVAESPSCSGSSDSISNVNEHHHCARTRNVHIIRFRLIGFRSLEVFGRGVWATPSQTRTQELHNEDLI